MTESSKEKAFARLAERRTNTILDGLRLLGNLSNPYAYAYHDEDIRQIFGAIERELRNAKAKFQNPGKTRFSLKRQDNEG